MSAAEFFAKMKRYQKNAELIFDEEEPVGVMTDLVMPQRRWFRRKSRPQAMRGTQAQQGQTS